MKEEEIRKTNEIADEIREWRTSVNAQELSDEELVRRAKENARKRRITKGDNPQPGKRVVSTEERKRMASLAGKRIYVSPYWKDKGPNGRFKKKSEPVENLDRHVATKPAESRSISASDEDRANKHTTFTRARCAIAGAWGAVIYTSATTLFVSSGLSLVLGAVLLAVPWIIWHMRDIQRDGRPFEFEGELFAAAVGGAFASAFCSFPYLLVYMVLVNL